MDYHGIDWLTVARLSAALYCMVRQGFIMKARWEYTHPELAIFWLGDTELGAVTKIIDNPGVAYPSGLPWCVWLTINGERMRMTQYKTKMKAKKGLIRLINKLGRLYSPFLDKG